MLIVEQYENYFSYFLNQEMQTNFNKSIKGIGGLSLFSHFDLILLRF